MKTREAMLKLEERLMWSLRHVKRAVSISWWEVNRRKEPSSSVNAWVLHQSSDVREKRAQPKAKRMLSIYPYDGALGNK